MAAEKLNPGRRALLGRLSALPWFVSQGEVACTHALWLMLEEPLLREATVKLAAQRTGVDLTGIVRFRSESVNEDGDRFDLEGLTDADEPVLVVEAKFGAVLEAQQIGSYVRNLQKRLFSRPGALLVLVPTYRLDEARRVVESVSSEHETSAVRCEVLDWDSWLAAWDDAIAGLPATSDSVAADLVQLREMCLTMGGLQLRPFSSSLADGDWRERAEDLAVIVDQVTRRLSEGQSRLLPLVNEENFAHSRYVPVSASLPGSYLAIGVRVDWADRGQAPVWVRIHRRAPGFHVMQDRLLASDLRGAVRPDQTHVWLPLDIGADAAGEEVVLGLIRQVGHISSVAAGTATT